MNINLKIDIEEINKDEKVVELLYNNFLSTEKKNKKYIFFPLIGLLLYQKLFNLENNLKKYNNSLIKKYFYKKIKDIYLFNIFRRLFDKVNNITFHKTDISYDNILLRKKNNYFNSQEIIFDKINNTTYKSIKNETIIYRYNNFIIKQYTFNDTNDNFCIVSIINEIITQLYAYLLKQDFCSKIKIIIPNIYNVNMIREYNNENLIKINIKMEYINNKIIKYKIQKKDYKIYYDIKKFLDYLEKFKLFHNDTHYNNLIITKEKIILLDFGKASLYNAFNPSISGFPKLYYLKNYSKNLKIYIKKYLFILIKKYIKRIKKNKDYNSNFLFYIY